MDDRDFDEKSPLAALDPYNDDCNGEETEQNGDSDGHNESMIPENDGQPHNVIVVGQTTTGAIRGQQDDSGKHTQPATFVNKYQQLQENRSIQQPAPGENDKSILVDLQEGIVNPQPKVDPPLTSKTSHATSRDYPPLQGLQQPPSFAQAPQGDQQLPQGRPLSQGAANVNQLAPTSQMSDYPPQDLQLQQPTNQQNQTLQQHQYPQPLPNIQQQQQQPPHQTAQPSQELSQQQQYVQQQQNQQYPQRNQQHPHEQYAPKQNEQHPQPIEQQPLQRLSPPQPPILPPGERSVTVSSPPMSSNYQPLMPDCPQCHAGVMNQQFTSLGLMLGVFCCPLGGFICCFLMRERKCSNCGMVIG